MNYTQYLHTALTNNAENISVLAHLSPVKLEHKMQLVKKQMGSARRFDQPGALEILQVWEDQIQQASELKAQLGIESNNTSDVAMELPELAALEIIEKRQEILRSKLLKNENIQL